MTSYYRFPRVCLTNRVCSHGVSTEGQDTLPGVTYSLDEQCAMHFGEGYAYYKYVRAKGSQLTNAAVLQNLFDVFGIWGEAWGLRPSTLRDGDGHRNSSRLRGIGLLIQILT